ncbi:MAG: 3'-5' exonuclease [Nitrospirae bacterium]|nr:3'-5' exonuclease [Nitrospirota bacterium]
MVTRMERLFGRPKEKIRRNAPITSLAFVSVDLELTGLNEKRDAIVSIGAVKMTGGRILLSDFFYRLINPNIPFRGPSVTIHGITPSDVHASDGMETVVREFIDFCGDDVIIGHCVEIDMAFLGRDIRKLTGRRFRNKSVDTLSVYKWLLSRNYYNMDNTLTKNSSLYEIAKYFSIPVEISHNAIMDAYITAQLFQRFIPALQCCGSQQIGDLLRIGNPSKGGVIVSGEFSNF